MDYKEFEQHLGNTVRDHRSYVDESALFKNLGIEETDSGSLSRWTLLIGVIIGTFLVGILWMGMNRDDHESTTPVDHQEKLITQDIDDPVLETSSKADVHHIDHQFSQESKTEIISETPKASVESTSVMATQHDHLKTSTNDSSINKRSNAGTSIAWSQNKEEEMKPVGSSERLLHSSFSNDSSNSLVDNTENDLDEVLLNRAIVDVEKLDRNIVVESISESRVPRLRQKITCPSFKEKKLWFEIGVEIGGGKLHNRFEDSSVESFSGVAERINNERSLEDLNARIFATINSKKIHLGLKLGIGVERYAHRMRHQTSYTVQDTTVGIINTIVSPTGDTITHIYGDIISEKTKITDRQRHYYLYNLNLPVGLTYRYDIGYNSIQLEGGAIFNLASWTQGNILASNESFEKVSDQQINHGFGITYYAQLNFMRQINQGFSVYISPYFQYSNRNYSAISNLRQQYHSEGIKIGLIRRF